MGFFGFGTPTPRAKPLIVHVDDDKGILDIMALSLTGLGLEVLSFTDGNEALKVVRSKVPDLVILDIRMPGIDGFDVCWKIKNDKKTAHVPVLMMTAMGQVKDIDRALAQGSDDYAVKPVDFAMLEAKVFRILKRPLP